MKRSTKIIIATVAGVVAIGAIAGTSIASKRGGWGGGCEYGMSQGYGGYGHHRGGGKGFAMIEKFDANKDGKLTAAELTAARDNAIAKHDADKDGKLSLDEFQGVWADLMRGPTVRAFQHLDANGDAKVTMDEIQVPMDRMMSRMDRNDDGVISKDDMRRGWKSWGDDDDDDDDDDRPRRGQMRQGN